MKHLLTLSFFSIFLLVTCGNNQSARDVMPWYEGTYTQAVGEATDSGVMLFFETEW